MTKPFFLEVAYLVSAVLFILGLKGLSSPKTARRGMFLAELAMLMAIVGTLLHKEIVRYDWIIAGVVIGSVIGMTMALRIPMTAVPQRTALSHSLGALAAALVGISEYYRHGSELGLVKSAVVGIEVTLGSLTFTGSLMAAAKLQGLITGIPITYKGQNLFNMMLLSVMVGIIGYLTFVPSSSLLFYVLVGLSLGFGLLLVLPIGAADMPVVISLLNSYGGLTDAAMGFLLLNRIQIITGSLDGSSGFVLSVLMCRAMNRSFTNVLFGAFGKIDTLSETVVSDSMTEKRSMVKSIAIEEAATIFQDIQSVIIVPGYGMAASQAQHGVRQFADRLKERGIKIKYAIHPVAGRMPGHMNVLLAEANVPYDELYDMDQINPYFAEVDIALVIGANDVVNPAAKRVKASPIFGMPILEVEKAKMVIVCKRSLAPGFAGIDNELYYNENTMMLFGDAKETMLRLSSEVKK